MDTIAYLASGVVGAVVGAACAVWMLRRASDSSIPSLLQRHFSPTSLADLLITERKFPLHMRADIYQSLVSLLDDDSYKTRRFTGVRTQMSYFGMMNLAELMTEEGGATAVAPQYEQVDVGEERPVRCLQNGLWLLESGGQRFAIFASQGHDGCGSGYYRIASATINNDAGAKFAEELFKNVEAGVAGASSYRGKILSFEATSDYSGQSSGVTVHKLRSVTREQVVLPARTLELLERNVLEFVEQRDELKRFKQATKKGLLFYGPPGTGKTHTIHHLAGALTGHTTLLISAEQVQHLSEYMTLARLLQPSLVVIEDVDLIARDREEMRNPQEEVLLNKLLNEMDGLREDAEILFVLTTNRPEKLENALASRPGRVDQAIEFPLPDDRGRDKLVRLYSAGVSISDGIVESVVAKTENVTASFIKELMRKAIQSHITRNGSGELDGQDLEFALDELLFRGGQLNLRLLGAQREPDGQSVEVES
jgi:hypothetical protein